MGSAAGSAASVNTVVRRSQGPQTRGDEDGRLTDPAEPRLRRRRLVGEDASGRHVDGILVADRGPEWLGGRAVRAQQRGQLLGRLPEHAVDALVLGDVSGGRSGLDRADDLGRERDAEGDSAGQRRGVGDAGTTGVDS
jgi:hypothetical protein